MRNPVPQKHLTGSFHSGFSYFLRGIALIGKPGVKRFVIIPLLINIGVFVALFWLAGSYFNDLLTYLQSLMPDALRWLAQILWIFFALLAGLFMFFTFTFFTTLIGAPFNGYLAAAVEKHLTGHAPAGSGCSLLQDIGVMMLSELKKWSYYLLWAIPLFVISIFISPLAPFLWFVFGAWMFSIEYLDYPMGNHGHSFGSIRRQLAQKRSLSLGYGSAVTVATLLPVFNFIVMPIAVAGATLLHHEHFRTQHHTDAAGEPAHIEKS